MRTNTGLQSLVAMAWLCGSATGCVPALQGPAAKEPKVHAPAAYTDAAVADGHAVHDGATTAKQGWDDFFTSAELRGLIQAALTDNKELNIRLQDIIIAHNEVMARQGEYLPKLNASVGVGAEKVGKYTSQGASDDATNLPQNLGNFTFGVVGSWEADVWSKLRNAKKAASLRYLASIDGQRFLTTQIVAELARAYYELLAIDSQLDILQKSIRVQDDTLSMVRLEKEAARVTELAVQRFEADLLRFKSRTYKLEQERVRIENRINFLAGRYPQPIKRSLDDFRNPPPAYMATGLPAALLENRTDVRQAEWELAATKLDVKAAKAAFYPSLRVEAGAGFRAFNPAHLVATPASLFYDAVGGLVAPLLNRKAITAQYASANATQVQAVMNYEQTLLRAFTDVANQLSAAKNWHGMYDLLSQEVDTLSQAVDISGVLFQAARAEYIEVLTTRRDYLEAQMELVETNKQRFMAMVNLYQALGGGWLQK